MKYDWYYVVKKTAENDPELNTWKLSDGGEFIILFRSSSESKADARRDEYLDKNLERNIRILESNKFYNPGHVFRSRIPKR